MNQIDFKKHRSAMIRMMVDFGEIVPLQEDYFEDMGGHCIHESGLDSYFEYFLKNLSDDDRKEVIQTIAGEG